MLCASLYVRCSYWVEMISSPWPESMCLQGRGNNVGDTVIPLIYNVSNCDFIMSHDTLVVSNTGPTVNMLSLQVERVRSDC